jgi:hypothetical protein
MWQSGALLRGRPRVAILNAQECASAIRRVGLNALQGVDPNRLEFLLYFMLGTTVETAFECRGSDSWFQPTTQTALSQWGRASDVRSVSKAHAPVSRLTRQVNARFTIIWPLESAQLVCLITNPKAEAELQNQGFTMT